MQIHVLDLQDFDQIIETDTDIILNDLLKQINEKFQYDTSSCTVYHFGQKLEPNFHLTSDFLKDDNILVLLNNLIVKEKSYPKVDNAYRFQKSRFRNYFFEPVNTNELCPKLENLKQKDQSNQNSFENSFYNNIQIQLNPNLAILPHETTQPKIQSYEMELNLLDLSPDLLSRYSPEQVQSLCRILETGHNPRLVFRIFDMVHQDEEQCLRLLNSFASQNDF